MPHFCELPFFLIYGCVAMFFCVIAAVIALFLIGFLHLTFTQGLCDVTDKNMSVQCQLGFGVVIGIVMLCFLVPDPDSKYGVIFPVGAIVTIFVLCIFLTSYT